MDAHVAATAERHGRPARRRFTAAEYNRMGEVGILHEDDRIELIMGEILTMPAIGDRHIATVIALTQILTQLLGPRAFVSIQNPVRLDDESEPEPDVAVLRPRRDYYRAGKPRPDDILLLVEVADSSLDYDHGEKRELYARSGIAEYWVVNLVADEVEVCRDPTPGGYASLTAVGPQGSLAIAAFPGSAIPVGSFMPDE